MSLCPLLRSDFIMRCIDISHTLKTWMSLGFEKHTSPNAISYVQSKLHYVDVCADKASHQSILKTTSTDDNSQNTIYKY